MTIFDDSLCRIAREMGLYDPISVSCDFDHSTVRVGYSFRKRQPTRIVEMQFGAMISLLTMCEFDALIAHEFAHVVAGHTSKIGFKSLHLINRFVPKPVKPVLENVVVLTLRFKSLWLGRQHEFQADRIACAATLTLSIGSILVKGAAFDYAVCDLNCNGRIGGFSPVFENDKTQAGSHCLYTLTSSEKSQLIAHTFEVNRSAFLSCSQKAKRIDKSTCTYPSDLERLRRIGLDWETAEYNCNFSSDTLINFASFSIWARQGKQIPYILNSEPSDARQALDRPF